MIHLKINKDIFNRPIEERKKTFKDIYSNLLKTFFEFSYTQEEIFLAGLFYGAMQGQRQKIIQAIQSKKEDFKGITSALPIELVDNEPYFLKPILIKDEYVTDKSAFNYHLQDKFNYYQNSIILFKFTNQVYFTRNFENQTTNIKGLFSDQEKLAEFLQRKDDKEKIIEDIRKLFFYKETIPLKNPSNEFHQFELVLEIFPLFIDQGDSKGYFSTNLTFDFKGYKVDYSDQQFLNDLIQNIEELFNDILTGKKTNVFKLRDPEKLLNEVLIDEIEPISCNDIQLNLALSIRDFNQQPEKAENMLVLSSNKYIYRYNEKINILNEQNLADMQDRMFLNITKFKPDIVLVLNALLYLYRDKPKDGENFIDFHIDEILELLNYKKKISGAGIEGGYPEKKRQEIAEYIRILKNFEIDTKDLNIKTDQNYFNYGESQIIYISRWGDLSKGDIYRYRFMPGEIIRLSLKLDNEFTLLDGCLMKTPSEYNKFLGLYISLLWKTGRKKRKTKIKKLLEYTINIDFKNPMKEYERFEKALFFFEENNLIKKAIYKFNLDEYRTDKGDMKHGWFNDFLKTQIILYRPAKVRFIENKSKEMLKLPSL